MRSHQGSAKTTLVLQAGYTSRSRDEKFLRGSPTNDRFAGKIPGLSKGQRRAQRALSPCACPPTQSTSCSRTRPFPKATSGHVGTTRYRVAGKLKAENCHALLKASRDLLTMLLARHEILAVRNLVGGVIHSLSSWLLFGTARTVVPSHQAASPLLLLLRVKADTGRVFSACSSWPRHRAR